MRDPSSSSLSLTLHIPISVFWNAQAGTMASIVPSLFLDADTRRYSSTPNSCPSSPATVDIVWPNVLSPTCEIPCESPGYAWPDCSEHLQSVQRDLLSNDWKPDVFEAYIFAVPQPVEAITFPPSITGPNWQGSEDESARNHDLYKNATTSEDGLYHCPWEGTQGCNHKPEKLKCKYDEFVNFHLKPYVCKVESCENDPFSSEASLHHHEREMHGLHGHGDKPFFCSYQDCPRALPTYGFRGLRGVRSHMKRMHNNHADHVTSHFLKPISGGQDTARTVTSTRMPHACSRCRARKIKCDVSVNGNGKCFNCIRDQKECVIPPRKYRRRAGRTAKGTHKAVQDQSNSNNTTAETISTVASQAIIPQRVETSGQCVRPSEVVLPSDEVDRLLKGTHLSATEELVLSLLNRMEEGMLGVEGEKKCILSARLQPRQESTPSPSPSPDSPMLKTASMRQADSQGTRHMIHNIHRQP
ncbi:hypothetical protein B0J13DRAFT_165422 [Dactylonectria estremocensis]|uniref:Zn(2)-C6 fungal-type domain-containing protein n=1 Tax=Dactylonectria estremocensis TaxID=1079267 RepID=A0A9P9DJ32_9HYPO|nr:hypothetical protein B0J13DRAFT_165422 [Dactylonectria estremocensis]